MDELAQRVALVTGGSGGIGAELSRQLGQTGAAVAVHYATNRAGTRAENFPLA